MTDSFEYSDTAAEGKPSLAEIGENTLSDADASSRANNPPIHSARTKLHDAARGYAAKGWPIFPIIPGEKRPACSAGFKDATINLAQIDEWWSEADYNIGFEPATCGMAVIDRDPGGQWKGAETVKTPRGAHYYYSGSLPSTASKISPHVDSRSVGGYVLLPPSIVGGIEYEWRTDEPDGAWDLPPLPAVAIEAASRSKVSPVTKEVDFEPDTPAKLAQARQYIDGRIAKGDVPVAGDRNTKCFKAAAMLRDFGLSEDATLAEVERWCEAGDGVPEDQPLEDIVNSAYRGNAQNTAGAKTGEVIWSKLAENKQTQSPQPSPEPTDDLTVQWPRSYRASALAGMSWPLASWAWHERLLKGMTNLWTGDRGVGKTTLAENLAVAVAGGVPLLGCSTEKMPVFLLVGEDTYGDVDANLRRIAERLGVPEVLADVEVRSVKSDRIDTPTGHALVAVTDNGEIIETDFMREVIKPTLTSFAGPVLWIVDPISEFAVFDRFNDIAARKLWTGWFEGVIAELCGHVTILATDHPSVAGMREGRHQSGSVQMTAAPSLFGTLIATKDKDVYENGRLVQRELSLEIIKARHGSESKLTCYRLGDDPAFSLDARAGHSLPDDMVRVCDFVVDYNAKGHDEPLRYTNHGFGPTMIGAELRMPEASVKAALSALIKIQWLTNERAAEGRAREANPGGLRLHRECYASISLAEAARLCAKLGITKTTAAEPNGDDGGDTEITF
jgi:bifunctional DNA primase/polymerase-like protein/AAA domain-containing protein